MFGMFYKHASNVLRSLNRNRIITDNAVLLQYYCSCSFITIKRILLVGKFIALEGINVTLTLRERALIIEKF